MEPCAMLYEGFAESPHRCPFRAAARGIDQEHSSHQAPKQGGQWDVLAHCNTSAPLRVRLEAFTILSLVLYQEMIRRLPPLQRMITNYTLRFCRLDAMGARRFGELRRFGHTSSIQQTTGGRPKPSVPTSTDNSVPHNRSGSHRERIAEFFKSYPGFQFNEDNDAIEEWRRLCRETLKVDPRDRKNKIVRKSRRRLNTALVHQFNTRYGKDDALEPWRALCRQLNIAVPPTVRECRKAVQRTHVNLVDLTQVERNQVPKIFETEKALSEYTRRTGRIFPKKHAKAGGLLKKLLRQIDAPREEVHRQGRAKPRSKSRGAQVKRLPPV